MKNVKLGMEAIYKGALSRNGQTCKVLGVSEENTNNYKVKFADGTIYKNVMPQSLRLDGKYEIGTSAKYVGKYAKSGETCEIIGDSLENDNNYIVRFEDGTIYQNVMGSSLETQNEDTPVGEDDKPKFEVGDKVLYTGETLNLGGQEGTIIGLSSKKEGNFQVEFANGKTLSNVTPKNLELIKDEPQEKEDEVAVGVFEIGDEVLYTGNTCGLNGQKGEITGLSTKKEGNFQVTFDNGKFLGNVTPKNLTLFANDDEDIDEGGEDEESVAIPCIKIGDKVIYNGNQSKYVGKEGTVIGMSDKNPKNYKVKFENGELGNVMLKSIVEFPYSTQILQNPQHKNVYKNGDKASTVLWSIVDNRLMVQVVGDRLPIAALIKIVGVETLNEVSLKKLSPYKIEVIDGLNGITWIKRIFKNVKKDEQECESLGLRFLDGEDSIHGYQKCFLPDLMEALVVLGYAEKVGEDNYKIDEVSISTIEGEIIGGEEVQEVEQATTSTQEDKVKNLQDEGFVIPSRYNK